MTAAKYDTGLYYYHSNWLWSKDRNALVTRSRVTFTVQHSIQIALGGIVASRLYFLKLQ